MIRRLSSSVFTAMWLAAVFTAALTEAAEGAAEGAPDTVLEFYMHDILGGASPTTRPITGLLGNIYNGQVPFAKKLGFVPPEDGIAVPNANGAVPTLNGVNGIPLGNGLSGVQTQAGPDGLSLGFGTITVIDDVLTTGPELTSQALGKAQGIYVSSSVEGKSLMMAFTAMMEGGEYNDSLNFYGVYKTGSSTSRLSVAGGTGKFKNVCGVAEVRALVPPGQQVKDGAESLLRIIVHLKY